MQPASKHFRRTFFHRQTLLVALTVSTLAHVTAYIATHDLAFRWHASTADSEPNGGTALNAILLAADEDAPQKIVTASATSAAKTTARKPPARKNTTPRPAKSAALFAAPENAIAVAASASTSAPALIEPEVANDAIADAATLQKRKDGNGSNGSNSTEPEVASATATTGPTNEALFPSPSPSTSASTSASTFPPAANADTAPNSEPAFSFPQRITMAYKISSSVADGIADFSFKRSGMEGRDYELKSTIQATGIFAGLFVGTFRQTSRGELTHNGIRPTFFSMQRGDAPADTAEFMRDKRTLKIIKHGETHLFPLPPRLQDTQSFLFQLAQEARQLRTSEDRIKVALTNARKLYRYEFRALGEETLQTRMGSLTVLHLKSDAADPEDVYDVWLSPKHFYLPVKIKFYMGKFLVEQTVSSIDASEN